MSTTPEVFVADKKLGFICAFTAATLMGFVGFFARHINAQGDFIAWSRMACGAILFFGILAYKGRLGDLKTYKISPSMVMSGFFMGNCLSAYIASTQLTSIANAVFFIYVGPIISTLLAIVFLRETLKLATVIAVVAVFIGMMAISGFINYGPEGLSVGIQFAQETFLGDMLGLYSGVGYGLFLFFGRYRTEVPGDVRAFWNFVFAVAGITILFTFTQPTIAQMTASDWMWWVGIGFVCGFGALGTCTIATRHLKAVEFACVSYWECVVAAVFIGYLFYGETMSGMQLFGGALIIFGGMSEMLIALLKSAAKKSQAKKVAPTAAA